MQTKWDPHPHTSYRLQPLDLCVFGPYKKYYSQAAQNWLLNYPNETLSIFEVSELSCKAWDRAATPENIKSGFLKCGVEPFDRHNFRDHDFMCSSVSDRPNHSVIPENTSSSLETLAPFHQPDEISLNLCVTVTSIEYDNFPPTANVFSLSGYFPHSININLQSHNA